MTNFADRLKKLRNEKGINVREMAEILGVSRTSVSRYENDDTDPNSKIIEKAADYFGVSINYILGRSELRKDPNEKIRKALEDDPELLSFWEEMNKRDDIKLMFKQTRDMSPEAVKSIVNFMANVEKEHEKHDNF